MSVLPPVVRDWIDVRVSKAATRTGVASLLWLLTGAFFGLIAFGGLVRYAVAPRGEGLAGSLWNSFEHGIDVAMVESDLAPILRVVGAAQVGVGIVFVAVLTALVITALQDKVNHLRDGSGALAIRANLVILGHPELLKAYLDELWYGISVKRRRPYRIAILSDSASDAMRGVAEWKDEHSRKKYIDVRVFSGNPTNPADLNRVRASEADGLLVLSRTHAGGESQVVRTLLALSQAGYRPKIQHCVVEVTTAEEAAMVDLITSGHAKTVDNGTVLALLFAQAIRAQGLSQVIDQLVSYRGCEIYLHAIPKELVGRTFGELVISAKNCCPVGVYHDRVHIRPAMERPFVEGDLLIVVAKKYELPVFASFRLAIHYGIAVNRPLDKANVLVVGWNLIVATSLRHLRAFIDPVSRIDVIALESLMSESERRSLAQFAEGARVLRFDSSAEYYAAMDDELRTNSHEVVVLAPYRDLLSANDADSHTLLTMTYARNALSLERSSIRFVAELRSGASKDLAATRSPDDLVISDALAASLALQIVDRPHVEEALADLLDPRGSAIYVHSLDTYFEPNAVPITFAHIAETVALGREIAIGLRMNDTIELSPNREELLSAESIQGVVVIASGTIPEANPPTKLRSQVDIPV